MTYLRNAENCNFLNEEVNEFHVIKCTTVRTYLLFKIPSVFFINENKVEVISCAKFLVNFAERWCKIKSTKEESDGYCFSYINFINFPMIV